MNDPMTCIHPDAKIGRNVVISPFTTISAHVEIGDDCWIGPNVTPTPCWARFRRT